jgi:hypothetical protein
MALRSLFRRSCRTLILASLVLVGAAAWAAAQPPASPTAGPGGQAADPDTPSRDYLFGRPRGSLAVRGLWQFAVAGSDIFDFVTEELTLEKSAFNAPGIAVDLDIALSPRLDLAFGIDNTYTSKGSEYRDYVDNNELPIEQTTSLREFGIYGGLKYALAPRGRRVSRFAWIPRAVVPYIGAGGGVVKYEFEQTGDFVDFADLSVFTDTFHSEGWAPSLHACGGVDIHAYRILYVTAEARYTWASAELEPAFDGFEPIDLSGFKVGAGIRIVF